MSVNVGYSRCMGETDKACRIQVKDFDEEFWVPKSCVHDDSEVYSATDGANEGDLIVTDWYAEQKGWD